MIQHLIINYPTPLIFIFQLPYRAPDVNSQHQYFIEIQLPHNYQQSLVVTCKDYKYQLKIFIIQTCRLPSKSGRQWSSATEIHDQVMKQGQKYPNISPTLAKELVATSVFIVHVYIFIVHVYICIY